MKRRYLLCVKVYLLSERKRHKMNTLIIYDSTFGNTAQIAQAMADSLGEHGTVRIALAVEAGLTEMKEIDLLLVGGPTQSHGLSPAIQTLLESFPRRSLLGVSAAAFDTRYHMAAWKSGSAAHRIASKLKRAGTSLIMPPESFFVAEREGPLEEGELERAARWAEGIVEQFETSRSVQQDEAEVR
jgi:flavodoxin I